VCLNVKLDQIETKGVETIAAEADSLAEHSTLQDRTRAKAIGYDALRKAWLVSRVA